ncbi:FkbM family methyltransferase [Vibrio salilacus]|uniref:FkbM family methyltransferase n=1 Tax=Vibrio salilacus TaxID=1323749 RepID=UPI000C2AE019|nr:FkbM family methyltransferase [Vibrio salilacus]
MSLVKKVIKQAIYMIEYLTDTTITIRRKPRVKIDTHPSAVSDGTSMQQYVELIEKFCNFTPKNIVEIGANFAQDAEFLRQSFKLNEKDVFVFEPHPQIFQEIKNRYNFNNYELAVSNTTGRARFNAIDIQGNEYGNSGISSLRDGLTTNKKNFVDVDVEMIRMDDFLKENAINEIDFLKVDVEGMNYEVLEGFGEDLNKVKIIQTEGEYKQYWKGQKLYRDMEEYLTKRGFLLVDFKLSVDGVQSDSLWIQRGYIK